jgi:rSAM/selenodomain-associated transferase 2
MISVIIPTYNEADQIVKTLARLFSKTERPYILEVIVSDGGSSDNTVELARKAGSIITCTKKGRAAQMNAGAAVATGSILYFLHADTLPPTGFGKLISDTVKNGNRLGCFRLQFDCAHWFLRMNSWFTRFNISSFRFGDQSLFICKGLFFNANGFRENMVILEDQELITRLQKTHCFTVLPAPIITSARKYLRNGIYKTQVVYFFVYCMYRLGYSQAKLLKMYCRLIKQDKL